LKSKNKIRLDQALVQRGMTASREKARVLIMAGEVRVDGQLRLKASCPVGSEQEITLHSRYPYVSRGAFKIEKALERFDIDPRGLKILDIGISTGGFSDLLLKKGADSIQGIDVNIRQVDASLRQDPRVTLTRLNARYLKPDDLVIKPDLVVIDVSFISVLKILDALRFLDSIPILALIKPQFEAPRNMVRKGGVIRDEQVQERIIRDISEKVINRGWKLVDTAPAGVRGRKGNQEFFFQLSRPAGSVMATPGG
jgi:23S rRNA (cytidine1920-2'-O)/16S rRNA (cytidine1409-2'-O)-methyltransferase